MVNCVVLRWWIRIPNSSLKVKPKLKAPISTGPRSLMNTSFYPTSQGIFSGFANITHVCAHAHALALHACKLSLCVLSFSSFHSFFGYNKWHTILVFIRRDIVMMICYDNLKSISLSERTLFRPLRARPAICVRMLMDMAVAWSMFQCQIPLIWRHCLEEWNESPQLGTIVNVSL